MDSVRLGNESWYQEIHDAIFEDIPLTFPEHFRENFKKFLGFFSGISTFYVEISLNFSGNFLENFLEHSQKFPDFFLEISRKISRNFVEISWNFFRKLPGNFIEVSWTFIGHFQKISGKFPGNIQFGNDDGEPASPADVLMHIVSVPWKFLFALGVPPAAYAGGWICFLFALVQIGGLTAIIIDFRSGLCIIPTYLGLQGSF